MKIYNIASLCMLGLATLGIASCSDNAEEVTQMTFSKNFAPLNADTKTTKETSATITWKASANATGYNVEVFADDSLTFAGTPVQVLSTTETEITINNLLFDTRYSVRIQAITNGNDGRASSWTHVTFKTNAKQFLKNPKESDISDRSVTLTWNVEDGYDLTTIVVGNITHEVTPAEKAAQSATITGLTPETQYTAYLYYNGKECGKRTFTTIADLEGAVILHDTDDLKAAVEAAVGGEVFALYGGTYLLNASNPVDDVTGEELPTTTGAVKVSKSITIKGIYPTSRPVLKGRFEIYDGASLEISQVVIDGSMNAKNEKGRKEQVFNFKTTGAIYGSLIVQNTEIRDFEGGKGLVYLSSDIKSTVDDITFNNCIIHDITTVDGDFIDCRGSLPRKIALTNSTFYNVALSRDFIRVDDVSDKFEGQAGPVVTVDHCTLYMVGCGTKKEDGTYEASNNRLLYVRYKNNKLTWTNNLTAGTIYKRGFANGNPGSTAIEQWAGADQFPTLQNNFYFQCENLTSPKDPANTEISWFDTSSTQYDVTTESGVRSRGKGNGTVLEEKDYPFKVKVGNQNLDPDCLGGDFTLNPDGLAAKAGAGDPRWKK